MSYPEYKLAITGLVVAGTYQQTAAGQLMRNMAPSWGPSRIDMVCGCLVDPQIQESALYFDGFLDRNSAWNISISRSSENWLAAALGTWWIDRQKSESYTMTVY